MAVRRVLIIDDDPSVLTCYGRLFRRQGYEPCLEPNGRSVEARLETYRDVGVMILDYRMPGVNGLDLVDRLRRLGFQPETMLVSACTTPEMIEQARGLGIQWVFSKPVDTGKLLGAVAAVFGAGRAGGKGSIPEPSGPPAGPGPSPIRLS